MTKSSAGVLGLAFFRVRDVIVSPRHGPGVYGVVKLSPVFTCEMKSL